MQKIPGGSLLFTELVQLAVRYVAYYVKVHTLSLLCSRDEVAFS